MRVDLQALVGGTLAMARDASCRARWEASDGAGGDPVEPGGGDPRKGADQPSAARQIKPIAVCRGTLRHRPDRRAPPRSRAGHRRDRKFNLPGSLGVSELPMWCDALTTQASTREHRSSTTIESLLMSNAINAHKHRTKLHVLRDRVKRALRDKKRGVAGAAERVAAHSAKRAEYRAANP